MEDSGISMKVRGTPTKAIEDAKDLRRVELTFFGFGDEERRQK